MILYQCDWCGYVKPAGRGCGPSRACNPIIEPPQNWQVAREHLGLHVYVTYHFCTEECVAAWTKPGLWRKGKKRRRATGHGRAVRSREAV